MSETETTLRFVVPLDLARPEDRALFDAFQEVSNGLNGSVARLLMQRSLPKNAGGIDALLIDAVRDQAARKRLRGRPLGSGARRPPSTPEPAAQTSVERAAQATPPSEAQQSPARVAPVEADPAGTGTAAAASAVVAEPASQALRDAEKVSGGERPRPEGSGADPAKGDVRSRLGGLVAWTS